MEHFYIASADSAEEPTPEGNKRNETFSLDPGYEYIYDATKGKKAIVFSNSREEMNTSAPPCERLPKTAENPTDSSSTTAFFPQAYVKKRS